MKKILAVAVCAALTGCAGLQQAVQAYGGVAVSNAKAANDTFIDGYKVALCALPLSAIVRHPELIPSIRSLCIRPEDRLTHDMLDAIERQANRVQP